MSVDNSMVGHLSLALPGRPTPQGPDYRALIGKLLSRVHIFLIAAAAGAALGFGAQSLVTPRYTSATEIVLDPKRADSFGADASFGNISVDFLQNSQRPVRYPIRRTSRPRGAV